MSVDLPTLGVPTTATYPRPEAPPGTAGGLSAPASARAYASKSSSVCPARCQLRSSVGISALWVFRLRRIGLGHFFQFFKSSIISSAPPWRVRAIPPRPVRLPDDSVAVVPRHDFEPLRYAAFTLKSAAHGRHPWRRRSYSGRQIDLLQVPASGS